MTKEEAQRLIAIHGGRGLKSKEIRDKLKEARLVLEESEEVKPPKKSRASKFVDYNNTGVLEVLKEYPTPNFEW